MRIYHKSERFMEFNTDQRFLPVIFRSIPHGIFTIDDRNRITSFNRAAEKITGYSATEALGKRCYEVFRADICQQECPLKRSVRTMEITQDREVTILTKDGVELVISICTAALTDDDGNILGGVEMFRDLSQVVELRKRLTQSYVFEDIVSKNDEMRRILDRLPLIAASASTVLIQGPSGTGKELVAQAIHNLSPRKKKPFISLNCAALPDSLLESELFGYVKGAFTDAVKDKPGRFKLADTGSIFLDEIAEVSTAMQVKLLRVLQEKKFEPLGAIKSVEVDVRIIAATNRNLEEELKAGRFRDDLYYRLNVIRIHIPPLVERCEDIPLLVNHFIERFNRIQGRSIRRINEDALAALMRSPLPGNVRELENAVEHAFVLCRGGTIELQHLPSYFFDTASPAPPAATRNPLNDAEYDVIREMLDKFGGNRELVAQSLGVSRSTLWRKMKRFNLLP